MSYVALLGGCWGGGGVVNMGRDHFSRISEELIVVTLLGPPLSKMEIKCVRNELKISIRFCTSSCNNEKKNF